MAGPHRPGSLRISLGSCLTFFLRSFGPQKLAMPEETPSNTAKICRRRGDMFRILIGSWFRCCEGVFVWFCAFGVGVCALCASSSVFGGAAGVSIRLSGYQCAACVVAVSPCACTGCVYGVRSCAQSKRQSERTIAAFIA